MWFNWERTTIYTSLWGALVYKNNWFRRGRKANLHRTQVASIEFLKLFSTYILYFLYVILEWKESIIVPIHKKGDRMNCNN